jgi:hypothetical protein
MAPSAVDMEQVNGKATLSPNLEASQVFENGFTSPAPATNGASGPDWIKPLISAETFEYPPKLTPYKILHQYHSKPRKLRVACVGAGPSGLCVIYKMVKQTHDVGSRKKNYN